MPRHHDPYYHTDSLMTLFSFGTIALTMSPSSPAPRFEFVNFFGRPAHVREDRARFRKVKQHVMYDYFRKRGKVAQHRFRENPRNRDIALARPMSRSVSSGTITREADLIDSSSVSTGSRSIAEVVLPSQSRVASHSPPFIMSISKEMDVHFMDPFDTLPVKRTPTLEKGVRWFFIGDTSKASLPWLRTSNQMWKERVWKLSLENHGLFHNMITLGEASRARRTGQMDIVTWLYYKGQAIQAIREGLSNDDSEPSDAFLMLVSTQLSMSMLGVGEDKERFRTAGTHREAILKLLQRRGGLANVQTWMALNHMIWSDLRLAAATFTKPALPCEPRFAAPTYPPEFEQEAECRTIATFKTFPTLARTTVICSIFGHLQHMSLTFDEKYGQAIKPETAMNPCYQAAYHLYHILSSYNSISQANAPSIDPVQAILVTAGMYIWTCIPDGYPEIYHSPQIHNIQISHLSALRKCLDASSDIVASWLNSGANLHSLLWVLYQGLAIAIGVSAPGSNDVSWFLNRLNQVAAEMKMEDLNVVLRLFPRSKPFPNRYHPGLYQSLEFPSLIGAGALTSNDARMLGRSNEALTNRSYSII